MTPIDWAVTAALTVLNLGTFATLALTWLWLHCRTAKSLVRKLSSRRKGRRLASTNIITVRQPADQMQRAEEHNVSMGLTWSNPAPAPMLGSVVTTGTSAGAVFVQDPHFATDINFTSNPLRQGELASSMPSVTASLGTRGSPHTPSYVSMRQQPGWDTSRTAKRLVSMVVPDESYAGVTISSTVSSNALLDGDDARRSGDASATARGFSDDGVVEPGFNTQVIPNSAGGARSFARVQHEPTSANRAAESLTAALPTVVRRPVARSARTPVAHADAHEVLSSNSAL